MPAPARVKPSMGCAYAIFLLLGLIGVPFLWAAGDGFVRGKTMESMVPGVIGAILCTAGLLYVRHARGLGRRFDAEERRRAEFPNEPWKWRDEWLDPVIKSKDAAGVGLAWFLAVCVGGMSVAVVYALTTKPDVPKPAYLMLLVPVVGVALLVSALYKTLQWRKFGSPRLILSTLPGSIGGYLGGVIEVRAAVVPETDAGLALRCIRRVTTGSGKNRSTSEHVVWEREERIAAEKWMTALGRTEIPVLFHIPAGQAATDLDTPDNQLIWRLTASAAVPGVDFSTTFEVPVFNTGETAPPPAPNEPALDVYRPQRIDQAALAQAGISRTNDGWKFDPAQLWAPKGISAAVAGALTWVLWSFIGHQVHWVPWTVTALFAWLAWLSTLNFWCARSEMRIEADQLVLREATWHGMRERRVRRADVADIRAERTMNIGVTSYYRLLLVGRGADASTPAAPNEPFATRKVRYEIRRLGRELGVDRPEQMGARGAELARQLAALPRFEICIAKHVRGSALAEAVRRMVLADVRGSREPVAAQPAAG